MVRGVYFFQRDSGRGAHRPCNGGPVPDLRRGPPRLAGQRASGRSYFITRLLREVVFAEAELAGTDSRLERRVHWLRVAAYAASPPCPWGPCLPGR